jgi:DNA-binding CsgD family transcriptional regulator
MSDHDEGRIDSLLGAVYEAVMAPEGFSQFLASLIAAFDLKAAMMLICHTGTNEIKGLWLNNLPQKWLELYALEYGAEDVLAQHMRVSPIARFYASNLDLDPSIRDSRFYRDWVEPQGVAFASGAIILREGSWVTQVMLQRTPQQPAFTRADMALLNRLTPHLQRAIQMRQRLADVQFSQQLSAASLDVLAMPTMVVNEFGVVAHANRSAQGLLSGRRELWLESGHLHNRSQALTHQINLEITKAIQASRGCAGEAPGVVLIPRSGRKDLLLLVSPLPLTETARMRGGALVVAFDCEQQPRTRPALLQQLFGLSEAEAALAISLCGGRTLEEVSIERGTSLHTVRSQLKNIFNKTGTGRQADLVSLLLTSPAYFLAHGQAIN